MAPTYDAVQRRLRASPRRWLVTGAAGFIGSHLVQRLLELDQSVVGLDNFVTGKRSNLSEVLASVAPDRRSRFRLLEGDIRDGVTCARACQAADVVLHQAALGSVPRSVKDPQQTHDVNVTGFLRVLTAARDAGVHRVVYASSSSVYGDSRALPKVEDVLGRPLSPYAASKLGDEIYAHAFGRCYGLELVGLRYFNVFGPRQDPNGEYAAVIPRWFAALLGHGELVIYGDGETSRDFCFVDNVVQANLLAATTDDAEAVGEVYNVAYGERTTLHHLLALIREQVAAVREEARTVRATYRDFRPGDVRDSLADTSKACERLGYRPAHSLRDGIALSAPWYMNGSALGSGLAERDASRERPMPRSSFDELGPET